MTLQLQLDDDAFFRESVVDDCPVSNDEFDPAVRAQRLAFEMVERVADGWGIDPAPGGREVWAVFLVGAAADMTM